MELIKELFQVLINHKKGIEKDYYNYYLNQNPLIKKYLELLKTYGLGSNNHFGDAEIAQKIYGSAPSEPKFRALKFRVKKFLINNLLLINKENNYPPFYNALMECNKNLLIIEALILNDSRGSAFPILMSTFKTASKFELLDIKEKCLYHILNHYRLIGDERSYKNYEKKYIIVAKIKERIRKADLLFKEITMSYRKTHGFTKKKYIRLKKSISDIEKIAKDIDSFQLDYFLYTLRSFHFQLTREFLNDIKNCNNFLKILKKKPQFSNSIYKGDAILRKMENYLYLGNYNSAIKCAWDCEKIIPKNSSIWLIFLGYYFLILIHLKNYKEAGIKLTIIFKDIRYKSQPETYKAKWKLYEGYLNFMKLSPWYDIKAENISSFDISSLKEEISVIKKDKPGLWCSFILLEMLFFLSEKKFFRFIDSIEKNKVFLNRYLEKEYHSKILDFFKALELLSKNNFKPQLVKENFPDLVKRIQGRKNHLKNSIEELEIIPFDDLWKKIEENI